jgi:hypothetical protein
MLAFGFHQNYVRLLRTTAVQLACFGRTTNFKPGVSSARNFLQRVSPNNL